MQRLQKSMTAYVKTLSKRNEGDDKEKSLPVSHLGSTMVRHGEDFEDDSEFGQCLISMPATSCSWASLTTQAWDGRMSGSAEFKKHTLQMRPRAGWNLWRGLWLR